MLAFAGARLSRWRDTSKPVIEYHQTDDEHCSSLSTVAHLGRGIDGEDHVSLLSRVDNWGDQQFDIPSWRIASPSPERPVVF